jgi:hypothetical protein
MLPNALIAGSFGAPPTRAVLDGRCHGVDFLLLRVVPHHRCAISVTVFQVAIALSAIAALTRRPLLFWCGLGGGLVGAILFAFGFA